MKTIPFAVFLALVSSSALAETLVLSDGRHFTDARVISQTPLYVTVRHAAGFSQVAKSLLPESWQSKYPADPAAAAAAAESAKARLAKAKSEIKIEKPTPLRPTPVVAPKTPEEIARINARALVDSTLDEYFRNKWRPALGAVEIADVEMKIAKLEQPPGWSGQWTFSGEGSVDYTNVIENEEELERRNPERLPKYRKFSRALLGFEGVIENGECTIKPRLISVIPLVPRPRERYPATDPVSGPR